ncbi:hypothetical protein TWF730_000680 [Orbilia blumenaviensis]|uniref:3-hydroxyisobutyryl-CoA hydrolase n=1 Tax=Orbilia blumenaviensis TaxID=1796055 RepID=A0AAV9VMN3_9PEZI
MILRRFCTASTASRALSISAHARPTTTMPLRARVGVNAMAQNFRSQSTTTTAPPVEAENTDDDVLFDSAKGARTITLNRPAKLNALSASMAGKILPRLLEWQKSQMANVIIIKGAGDRAFCAGGDVAVLAAQNRTSAAGQQASIDYFALEYKLDNLIAKYTKPYVAFMDGITMGGGVGLSLHGHFRIATERTMFSMPETTIGFFPDVGASFFLPRLDGYLGTYLALTSERLKGVQAYWAGVATHYIHSSSLQDLQDRLSELEFNDHDDLQWRLEHINSTIEEYVTGLPPNEPFRLGGETREAIDRCFRYNSIDEIMQALRNEDSEWANRTINTLRSRSPIALRVTLLEMRYGAAWTINSSFIREFHMARKFMNHSLHPDFVEGVEKQLAKPVDGFKQPPIWNPASIEETTDAMALQYFEIEEGAQMLDLVTVANEVDYANYPHGWLGLPSENAVKIMLGQGGRKTVEELEKAVLKQWDNKVGVQEKLRDVFQRKIKEGLGGIAEWKVEP